MPNSLIACLGLLIAWAHSWAYEPVEEKAERVRPSRSVSVVTVHALSSDGKRIAQGAGFFINAQGDVITSRHLLDNAVKVDIIVDGKTVSAVERIVADDREADIIQLAAKIPPELVHPLTLRKSEPEVGEKVMVLLSPVLVSDGNIVRVNTVGSFGSFFEQTAPISSAATGSPVVDLDGKVLGMVTALIIAGEEIVAGIPASRIRAMPTGNGLPIAQWQAKRKERSESAADGYYVEGLRRAWVAKYDSAVVSLRLAAQYSPDAPRVQRLLAQCYERLSRPQDQAQAIQQLIRINPSNLDSYFELAQLYGKHGYYTEVVAILEHALKVKEDSYQAFGYMGWAYLQMDSLKKAIVMGKKCIALKPDYDQGHVYLGMIYAAMDQREMAANAFQQALRINPHNADAHYQLGLIYGKQSEYLKELASLKEACRIRPNDAEILASLGMAYLHHLGNFNEAVAALKRARDLNPLDADVLYELGNAFLKAGEKDSALSVHRTLTKVHQDRARQLRAAIGK